MKWFDLSRYGSKLTVIPKSGARKQTVLRLTMPNAIAWNAQRDRLGALNPEVLEQYTGDTFKRALAEMGFGPIENRRIPSPDQATFDREGDEYSAWISEAQRESVKLSELQRLMPGLTRNDVVEMPLAEIVSEYQDVQGYEAQWEGLRRALVNDAVDVWAPVRNPWEHPNGKALRIMDALMGHFSREGRDRTIAIELAHKADSLGYRDDALQTYYVSEAAAQADGLKEGDYHRVGFAASVPLATDGGKVIALRDVWAMPDLRRTLSVREAFRLEPEQVGKVSTLITGYLREREAYRVGLRDAVSSLTAWTEKPSLLDGESSDRVWGAVSVIGERAELTDRYPWLTVNDQELLGVVPKTSTDSGRRLPPLQSLDERGMKIIASSMARDGVGTEADLGKLLEATVMLHKAMVEREVAQNRAKAMAVGDDGERLARSTDAPAPRSEGAALHVDVGEKIGGARKDYARRALQEDELANLNAIELGLHVTKQNVWPPLNYSAMRDDGVVPVVAMAIKVIKDSINTKPYMGRYATPSTLTEHKLREGAAKYVEVVGRVRDLCEGVRSEADMAQACDQIREYAGQGGGWLSGTEEWDQLGRDLQRALGMDNPLRLARNKIEKATRYSERNPETDRYERRFKDPWTALIKESKTASPDDVAERKRRADLDRELHMPHLEHVRRSGQDWRQGRDVLAEDLVETFGFRGVEYGNWLPQAERQEVVNMAYDSFADLAEALNLEPKDMSLGGELALAFGARGRGGKGSALAHFEPAKNVINLTRLKGAGALAHEWFHALDHRIGKVERVGLYATQHPGWGRDTPMKSLLERMESYGLSLDEIVTSAQDRARVSAGNAESWLYRVPAGDQRDEANRLLSLSLAEQHEEIKRLTQEMMKITRRPNVLGSSGLLLAGVQRDVADTVLEILVEKCGKKTLDAEAKRALHGNVYHWAEKTARAEGALALKHAGIVPDPVVLRASGLTAESQYLKDAKKMDENRGSDYWATKVELFARAGAAYVHDKLDARGECSQYLVAGSEEGRCLSALGASPNPRGDDRAAINACMEAVIDQYRMLCEMERAKEAESSLSI